MNYFLNTLIFDLKLNYNETDAKAFESLSTDTEFLGSILGKKINDNTILSYELRY